MRAGYCSRGWKMKRSLGKTSPRCHGGLLSLLRRRQLKVVAFYIRPFHFPFRQLVCRGRMMTWSRCVLMRLFYWLFSFMRLFIHLVSLWLVL